MSEQMPSERRKTSSYRLRGTNAAAPRRVHFAAMAMAMTALAIYGSLVPFHIRHVPWRQAIEQFAHIPYLALGVASRSDWVANILLFIPITFLGMGAFTADSRRWSVKVAAAVALVLAGIALSGAIEFTQIWFEPRTVSLNDIIAEGIGSVIGIALWLVFGQATTEWAREYTRRSAPRSQIDWLLEAYAIGLLIYTVLPLDLTISVGELVNKYHAGRIVLVPFSDIQATWPRAFGIVCDVVIFIPLGMLVAVWTAPAARPVRSMRECLVIIGPLAFALEFAQVFVYTRHASTTDALLSMVGMTAGAALMRAWRGASSSSAAATIDRRAAWLLAVAAVYAILVAVIFCGPFDQFAPRSELRQRYEMFWNIPFAAMYHGSEFNAVSEVLKKALLFAPLGVLSAMAIAPLRVPATIRHGLLVVALAACAAWATAIEMAQVFLPPHVPDITDVILCTSGAVAGALIALRVLRSEPSSSTNSTSQAE